MERNTSFKVIRVDTGQEDGTESVAWNAFALATKLAKENQIDYRVVRISTVVDEVRYVRPEPVEPCPHRHTRREGDEYVCTDCGKRWDTHEDPPA